MTRPRRPPKDNTLPPFTRRQFLGSALAAGALAGLPPGLFAGIQGRSGKPPKPRFERRTYFFNFAHEVGHDTATYYLVAGGNRYSLSRVQDHPHILKRHRKRNKFLQDVPDHQLTHLVENIRLSADFVTMSYVVQNPDTSAGTWSMSGMYLLPPMSGIMAAAQRMVDSAGADPIPLSAKRELYGHPAAWAAEDLQEESILLDPSEHATAIIGMHPDLLGVDGESGTIVQQTYIQPNAATIGLTVLLQEVGPATPQQTPGQPNATGWATLTPIVDDSTGQPFRNQNGNNKGLIQYHPAWSSTISDVAQQGVTGILPSVKADTTLGGDVTGADPSVPGPSGALWKRHDGFTTIDQSPGLGSVQDTLRFTLNTQNTESGFSATGSATETNGTVNATLTFTNWFVRWLGIYLLFLDNTGAPVDPANVQASVPPDYATDASTREQLNQELAMFGLLLGPEFTLLGIPVAAATATLGFNMPAAATTVRVFASGPSMRELSAVDPNDPETWGDWFPGMACTLILNYGLTILLMAAGASGSLSAIQKAALPLGSALAVGLTTLIGDELRNQDFSKPDVWQGVALSMLKAFLGALVSKRLIQLASLIVLAVAEGVAEDCIPLVGQIALGISLVAGAATLLETTIEIVASPVSYVYDLTLAHDITLNILHDPGDDKFPTVAAYYKVTAQFDGGATPYVQKLQMPPGVVATLPPVTFKNVPFGGKVTVTVGFYSSDDWLAGQGSTGSVANNVDTLPNITIEEFKVPIQPTTMYQHKQKTVLTDAQGTHGWLPTPTAPNEAANSLVCEQAAGNLCALRSITVRQGTSANPGYVGYSFQSSSSGVSACGSGGQGQLDQLVNMGDLNPQSGYATAGYGFQTGTKLTYSLFPGGASGSGGPTAAASDFYLDTTTGLVRRVRLDLNPPQFDPSGSGQAWGAFNLPSDDLLLHPSGRLVSIHNALHKMEILRLPNAPLPDADAKVKLLAYTHSGQGTRPGLLGGPTAAAISPDGVILVLEALNNRIQAFDLGANAVQFFKQQSSPYFLELTQTAGGDTVYLDLAVEYTGYLYVLSYNSGNNVYRLDIYHPEQTGTAPIATTQNMNAAKLAVDFWRNVYTLNYEVLQLPGGGFPNVTEPSVSLWQPSTP